MKSLTVLTSYFLLFLVFQSCSSDKELNSADLIGTWKLSEINNDPGDGSGVYTKVESTKNLVFGSNNTVTSNGIMCQNNTSSDSPSIGTYTLSQEKAISGTIQTSSCNNLTISDIPIIFELKKSGLYIYYPCIEGCSARYTK